MNIIKMEDYRKKEDAKEPKHGESKPNLSTLYPSMPCTYHIGSDAYPRKIATLTKSKKSLTLTNGEKFTLRKDGTFRGVGSNCGYLEFGVAYEYLDPYF